MDFIKNKSQTTKHCNLCNQVIAKDKFSKHYIIYHILLSNPKNIPVYSYNNGYGDIQYSLEQNQQINKALIDKQSKVEILVGKTIHKINLENFAIKITCSKYFSFCCLTSLASLTGTFDCTQLESELIMKQYGSNKKKFTFYDIYMSWLIKKIPTNVDGIDFFA